MPKRRRERDRPKANPDASYDPNKRVLLSYASSDGEEAEEGQEAVASIQPAAGARANDAELTDYHIDEYPDEESEMIATADVNAQGVEQTQEEETETAPTADGWKIAIKKNKFTNQFPTLGQWDDDGEGDEEEYDSTTEEAMAYLKAVRNERQSMPEILSAVPREVDRSFEDVGLNKDYDPDDAFVAEADEAQAIDNPIDPQSVFTRALIERFVEQRKQLRVQTSVDALHALGDDRPISFPQNNGKAYAEWHRILSSKAPQPAQLRALRQDTVFDLLRMIQKHFLSKGKNIKRVTSTWIWSLLARLDEVGRMNNDQVYPLRELGKRAVFVQYSVTNPFITAQLEIINETGAAASPDNDDESDPLSRRDSYDAGRPTSSEVDLSQITDNTKATLDMILVVVGNVFGQKDLLEFRQIWSDESDK